MENGRAESLEESGERREESFGIGSGRAVVLEESGERRVESSIRRSIL